MTVESNLIKFCDNSIVTFTENEAKSGAIAYSSGNCKIMAMEDSTVIINYLPAKWCTNGCIPYTGQNSDATIIDGNGIVWCSDNKAFTCQSKKCHCTKLENILVTTTKVLIIHINETVILSSSTILKNLDTILITGHNKATVLCINGSKLYLEIKNCNNIVVEGITWIGCGDFLTDYSMAVLIVYKTITATIINCSFQNLMGPAIILHNTIGNVNISNCSFINNNHYKYHGSCIRYYSTDYAKHPSIIIRANCNFSNNGPAKSVIYIRNLINRHLTNVINSNFYNNKGVAIYLQNILRDIISSNIIVISGKVVFQNNIAKNGAGIYLNSSTVIFGENSDVKYINNNVEQSGAAIFSSLNSIITFALNSRVQFNNNKASNGTIYSDKKSMVIFKGTCQVIFSDNSVTQYGAAIYSSDNSYAIFTGSSKVTFKNNVVSFDSKNLQVGGNIFSKNFGYALFDENSVTTFTNNSAHFGAAIFSLNASTINFKGMSRIVFNNNEAHYCGILTSALYSKVKVNDTAEVIFNNNTLSGMFIGNNHYTFSESAGTICTFIGANIVFSGYSSVTFYNNRAIIGGAAVFSESNVTIEEYARVIINNNIAQYLYGGAFACFKRSFITFRNNSYAVFHSNSASQSGGAIYKCKIMFEDNSVAKFVNNSAGSKGGAIVTNQHSEIIFEGNATVTFENNTADYGGTFYITNSTIIFTDASAVLFSNSTAQRNGGVGFIGLNSKVLFKAFSTVTCEYNTADSGGVFYFSNSTIAFTDFSKILISNNTAQRKGGFGYLSLNSKLIFKGSTTVRFENNIAVQNAGVLYCTQSYTSFKANSNITLIHNSVTLHGGALYFHSNSNVKFSHFTNLMFYSNKAFDGGAISANNSIITLTGHLVILFANNRAAQYGGAIFLDNTAVMINNCSNKNCINFWDNFANVLGNSLYQNIAQQSKNSCFGKKIININNKLIATPPKQLKFNYPAICVDKDDTQCQYYFIQNIMLGTEIVIPACVLDHYNHSVDSTQFLLQSQTHPFYNISGPKQILISCDTFKGISIMSNQILRKITNFSINITLNTVFNPSWRPISINLMIELSPCHLGFWHSPKSPKCECYNANDIVFCSGTTSAIKRGYWFGSVNGKPTVTFCPISYCNFTCETSNGYYQLSLVRNNQCRSHRSGTACGSCISDYTLSFDSPKCVRVKSCTAGKTVLVILLTLIYWILIVALVFALMYYRVRICYLYSITYYYSIVDILLTQASTGLHIIVNIISSFSKITPQFLGELCLTTGMSGIDQQFIHYIHPLAIIVILVIITLSARRYQRISNIIRRGIIHVICLLLLLSYTSMASTSLLLMRPLKFHDIDKVYTYLSPDIEYFHGRHLAYSIVALLCAISIVIGLPFLLILEPVLNHKINFIKIKPLLDQFQGSYKDTYRCFAGYFMICRLLIIIIVIANSSNNSVTSYILITVCGMIALVHQTIKPYANNEILNRFDGLILQLISFVAALPLLENSNSPLVVLVLITLPLLTFIAMTLFLNRFNLKKSITYFVHKIESTGNNDDKINIIDNGACNNETEFKTIIVDDSKRNNAIICDM